MLNWKIFRFVVTGAFFLCLKIRGIILVLCAIAFLLMYGKLMAIGTERQSTAFSIVLNGCLCVFFLILGTRLPDVRIFDVLFL